MQTKRRVRVGRGPQLARSGVKKKHRYGDRKKDGIREQHSSREVKNLYV